MITFSIKVEDDLHERLQQQLKATGKTRSAFVRELIERELARESDRQRELREKLMQFAGSCGRDRPADAPQADISRNVKKYLREWGFGLDRRRQPR